MCITLRTASSVNSYDCATSQTHRRKRNRIYLGWLKGILDILVGKCSSCFYITTDLQ